MLPHPSFCLLAVVGSGRSVGLTPPSPRGVRPEICWFKVNLSSFFSCSPFMVFVLIVVRWVYLWLLFTRVFIRAGLLHHIESGAIRRPLHPSLLPDHWWQPVLQVWVLKKSLNGYWENRSVTVSLLKIIQGFCVSKGFGFSEEEKITSGYLSSLEGTWYHVRGPMFMLVLRFSSESSSYTWTVWYENKEKMEHKRRFSGFAFKRVHTSCAHLAHLANTQRQSA